MIHGISKEVEHTHLSRNMYQGKKFIKFWAIISVGVVGVCLLEPVIGFDAFGAGPHLGSPHRLNRSGNSVANLKDGAVIKHLREP